MIRSKPRLIPLLLPILAAACSSPGSYPSLEQRPVERISGSAKPVAGPPAASSPALPPASANLATRLDSLVASARDADQQFQANRPAAERAVAAAGSVASDSWSTASVALARLESSRSQAMIALAELDTLYVDARTSALAEDPSSAKNIAAARDQVSDWVAAQDRVLNDLNARLRS